MAKCKMKIKNLYLEDFFINSDGTVSLIEFNSNEFYIFDSGSEAVQMKELISRELAIPENEINVYMVE